MRKAFTLIELLVIVAILLLLGSILFPALNNLKGYGSNSTSTLNPIPGYVEYTNDRIQKKPIIINPDRIVTIQENHHDNGATSLVVTYDSGRRHNEIIRIPNMSADEWAEAVSRCKEMQSE